MSQTGASGHDGGLVDGHGVFGVVRHDGMARFVVRRDALVLLVYFCAPSLRAFGQRSAADWPNITNMITGKLHQHPPIRILSLANSSSFMETMSFPSTAAFRAAWLTRFSRSAPEKPTVPRAIRLASIAAEKRQNSLR